MYMLWLIVERMGNVNVKQGEIYIARNLIEHLSAYNELSRLLSKLYDYFSLDWKPPALSSIAISNL